MGEVEEKGSNDNFHMLLWAGYFFWPYCITNNVFSISLIESSNQLSAEANCIKQKACRSQLLENAFLKGGGS